MLTAFDSEEHIAVALRSDAAGFILQATVSDQLAQLDRTPVRLRSGLISEDDGTGVHGYLGSTV